ncbi:hypothetical protein CLOM_g22988 [Closterium sp. NIES-68]|nr:hypothetical protein CLOM_g22988 [Closterium sp. NIES-68]
MAASQVLQGLVRRQRKREAGVMTSVIMKDVEIRVKSEAPLETKNSVAEIPLRKHEQPHPSQFSMLTNRREQPPGSDFQTGAGFHSLSLSMAERSSRPVIDSDNFVCTAEHPVIVSPPAAGAAVNPPVPETAQKTEERAAWEKILQAAAAHDLDGDRVLPVKPGGLGSGLGGGLGQPQGPRLNLCLGRNFSRDYSLGIGLAGPESPDSTLPEPAACNTRRDDDGQQQPRKRQRVVNEQQPPEPRRGSLPTARSATADAYLPDAAFLPDAVFLPDAAFLPDAVFLPDAALLPAAVSTAVTAQRDIASLMLSSGRFHNGPVVTSRLGDQCCSTGVANARASVMNPSGMRGPDAAAVAVIRANPSEILNIREPSASICNSLAKIRDTFSLREARLVGRLQEAQERAESESRRAAQLEGQVAQMMRRMGEAQRLVAGLALKNAELQGEMAQLMLAHMVVGLAEAGGGGGLLGDGEGRREEGGGMEEGRGDSEEVVQPSGR